MRSKQILRSVVATERTAAKRLAALAILRKLAASARGTNSDWARLHKLTIAIREVSVPLHLVELDGWTCRASMGAILDWMGQRIEQTYMMETIDPRTGERIEKRRTRMVPAHTVRILERAAGREPAQLQPVQMPEDAPLRITDPKSTTVHHATYRLRRGHRWAARPDDVRWTLVGSTTRYAMA